MSASRRDPVCVERWPECNTGEYDPRCCRFPKSCSCTVPTAISAEDALRLALAWIEPLPEGVSSRESVVAHIPRDTYELIAGSVKESLTVREQPTEIELDEEAVEAARRAVEDLLVEFRDSRISILGRGNGFVIRERDGAESSAMRLGTLEGLRVGIKAYLAVEAKRG